MIFRTIKIDLVPGGVPAIVHVSQYDCTTLTLLFEIYNGGTKFAKFEGATAKVEMTKPDTKAISNAASYNDDGTVSFVVTEQMTAKAGQTRGKIELIGPDGGQVGTAAFSLIVDPAGVEDGAIVSESDLPDIRKIIDAVDDVKQYTAQAVESAASAKSSETNAKTSETNAGKSASSAATSASKAKTSETNAASSKSAAATSATNAEASATAAAKSAESLAVGLLFSITNEGLLHIERKE